MLTVVLALTIVSVLRAVLWLVFVIALWLVLLAFPLAVLLVASRLERVGKG